MFYLCVDGILGVRVRNQRCTSLLLDTGGRTLTKIVHINISGFGPLLGLREVVHSSICLTPVRYVILG